MLAIFKTHFHEIFFLKNNSSDYELDALSKMHEMKK